MQRVRLDAVPNVAAQRSLRMNFLALLRKLADNGRCQVGHRRLLGTSLSVRSARVHKDTLELESGAVLNRPTSLILSHRLFRLIVGRWFIIEELAIVAKLGRFLGAVR